MEIDRISTIMMVVIVIYPIIILLVPSADF